MGLWESVYSMSTHTLCGGLFHHPALTYTRVIPEQSALFKIL